MNPASSDILMVVGAFLLIALVFGILVILLGKKFESNPRSINEDYFNHYLKDYFRNYIDAQRATLESEIANDKRKEWLAD